MKPAYRTAARCLSVAVSAVVALGTLSACSGGEDKPLTILAPPTPHAEILRWIDDQHDEFGLNVEVINPGVSPNDAVANGSANGNYYQHEPFLRDWTSSNGVDNLVNLGGVHIEPMKLYSTKYDSVDAIPDGAQIVLPMSPTVIARALNLLADNGVITLKPDADRDSIAGINLQSIDANPRNFTFTTVDDQMAAQAARDPKVAAAVASANFALESGLDLDKDALISESPEGNPYVNILVANEQSKDLEDMKELLAALQSPETARHIVDTYGDGVVPVTTPAR